MLKYLSALIALQISSAAYAQTCEVAEQYNRHGYVSVLSEAELSEMETLLKNKPTSKQTVDNMLGKGASDAILQNRYFDYLAEAGCENYVVNGKVAPTTNVVRMTRATMPKAELIELCKNNFPDRWEVDGEELLIKLPSGILRYRGRECSLLSFD